MYEMIALRVPPEMKKAIRAKAKSEDRTISHALRHIIKRWLAQDKQERPRQ